MAEKKFSKGSEEWIMFQDFWRLCQMVWIPEDSDEYWEKTVDMVENFVDKYHNDFAKALGLALIYELERRNKEK